MLMFTKCLYLQQAVSSSAPSSQSRLPSQSWLFRMHLGVPPAPPLGHRNLLSGQAMAVQFTSSDPSEQSLYPSQWKAPGMQRAFAHRNCTPWQSGKSVNENCWG